MSDPGFVYLLINPSMQGLVKIGKTKRDPNSRAKELSAVTGVPTPFILVFDAYFADCSRAEEYVHTFLDAKGYRISTNREFFSVPVNDAVSAILKAQEFLGATANPIEENSEREDALSLGDDFEPEPWQELFELAEASYYGLGDTLEDVGEALRLYKQAAKLGSAEACLRIGCIYRDNEDMQDRQQALTFFKEGASRGLGECYAEMASIYALQNQFENAHKCWSRYFESKSFVTDVKSRGKYGYSYIQQVKLTGLPVKHKPELLQIRAEILHFAEESLEDARQEGYGIYEGPIRFIRYVLYPEVPRKTEKGKVKWFNPEEGYGFIRTSTGQELFVHEWEIIEGPRVLEEGQLVELEVGEGPRGPCAYNVKVRTLL
jgi:cold shock CspA family protein